MTDWVGVTLRFTLYTDLLLLFGLAAYPLYAGTAWSLDGSRRTMTALAVAGLAVGIVAFLQMVAAMSGVAMAQIDAGTLRFVLCDTVPGTAFLVRTASLTLVAAAIFVPAQARLVVIAAESAIALASLAWTGHAAVAEGTAGLAHRAADIVHLLAAGAWIGALAVLAAMLFASHDDQFARAETALARFAATGSVIVALIALSGVVNIAMIVGVGKLGTLAAILYGQLLIAKLALFAVMLGHAAINRWRLTPRLARARESGDTELAVKSLRISIVSELTVAIAILGLVAWLGTLEPASA